MLEFVTSRKWTEGKVKMKIKKTDNSKISNDKNYSLQQSQLQSSRRPHSYHGFGRSNANNSSGIGGGLLCSLWQHCGVQHSHCKSNTWRFLNTRLSRYCKKKYCLHLISS